MWVDVSFFLFCFVLGFVNESATLMQLAFLGEATHISPREIPIEDIIVY